MKIKILGSGGGEGFPALFCRCDHCREARLAGGKSIRTLSQTLINDELLIDFPYDTSAHCLSFGIELGDIENVLITHSHSDHYVPLLLSVRGGVFAHNMKHEKIRFYGPADLEAICDKEEIGEKMRENTVFTEMYHGAARDIGGYRVTAISARHAPERGSLNYVIEQDGKRLLYLIDTGYPTEETLEYLKENFGFFDAVVMDATMGVAPAGAYVYHMGFAENIMLRQKLLSLGVAGKNTRFIAAHITHNKAETHEKTEAFFVGTGIEVSYDGFEFEI
jgi:phosphoribosyl 1,2-cyclic phosphate phosphodiesterase